MHSVGGTSGWFGTIGHVHSGDCVHVMLHCDGADQPVHDPKPVGQVLGAGQPVGAAAACILDGLPDSAATSIAGVGSSKRSTLAGGASPGAGSAGCGAGAAAVQAHKLAAAARDTANALMFTRTSMVMCTPGS
jgi:hypothetical protein